MLSGSGDATASVVTFEPVKTIGPAIAPAPEAPPHPVAMDSTETSEITPAQTRDEARSRWERTREPIRVDGLREVVCRGLKRFLVLSTHGRVLLRLRIDLKRSRRQRW